MIEEEGVLTIYKEDPNPKKGLCFRCEHRARYHETGRGPRCECQSEKQAVYSCYMYRPVNPVVLAPNEGDDRPMFAGSMFSGRSHFVRVFKSELAAKETDDGVFLYCTGNPEPPWRPRWEEPPADYCI